MWVTLHNCRENELVLSQFSRRVCRCLQTSLQYASARKPVLLQISQIGVLSDFCLMTVVLSSSHLSFSSTLWLFDLFCLGFLLLIFLNCFYDARIKSRSLHTTQVLYNQAIPLLHLSFKITSTNWNCFHPCFQNLLHALTALLR